MQKDNVNRELFQDSTGEGNAAFKRVFFGTVNNLNNEWENYVFTV